MKIEEWKYFKRVVADFCLTDEVINSGETNDKMEYNDAHKIFNKHLKVKMDAYEKAR